MKKKCSHPKSKIRVQPRHLISRTKDYYICKKCGKEVVPASFVEDK